MNILSQPKRLELLFRASEHGFKAQAFHEECDNVENTLVLVRTNYEKTIGGFSKYKWDYSLVGDYVNSPDKSAFLFSLSLKDKMVPQSSQKLIRHRLNFGPCFGESDLGISDNCN